MENDGERIKVVHLGLQEHPFLQQQFLQSHLEQSQPFSHLHSQA